jgi:capsular polysaccharide biosynthesis protein
LAGLLRAPDLIERVSGKLGNMPPQDLGENLRIMPERNSEILTVAVSAQTAEEAVRAANLFASEAVAYTQEMQGESANEISRFLHHQLQQVNQEIQTLNRQWWMVSKANAAAQVKSATAASIVLPPPTPARTILLSGKLDKARDELFDLLTRYTDAHPLVQAQRSKIAAIEKQMQQQTEPPAPTVVAGPVPSAATGKSTAEAAPASEPETDLDIIKTKLTALESARLSLLSRENTLQLFEKNSPGNYRVLLPATLGQAMVHDPKLKIIFLTVFASGVGAILAALILAIREIFDERLKTADDVARVTQLPVLARLNNWEKMSALARRDWAFRTWTMLQNRIGTSPHQGLVCGITASTADEERSVWMNMLAQAASQCGFKVLTITTKKNTDSNDSHLQIPSAVDAHKALTETLESSEMALLASNALSSPSEISQRLSGNDAQPMVHIPLPGWVWNLERRRQWKAALEQWQQIDNVVILVELPPASSPEAVLLAENLPNLIWLTESGKATATETRTQLETLNNACCNLVGAVLKDDSATTSKPYFARWTQTAAA